MQDSEVFQTEKFTFLLAALLGLIAGVAAKQAVALSTGHVPKPLQVLADFLVLGMVLLMVMFIHGTYPRLSVEAIALISAGLAMWGPKGIAMVLDRAKRGALAAVDVVTRVPREYEQVMPVHQPTMPETAEIALRPEFTPAASPVAKLRDVIPLESKLPLDHIEQLARIDDADEAATKQKGGEDNG